MFNQVYIYYIINLQLCTLVFFFNQKQLFDSNCSQLHCTLKPSLKQEKPSFSLSHHLTRQILVFLPLQILVLVSVSKLSPRSNKIIILKSKIILCLLVGIKSTSIVVLTPSITQQPLPPVPKRRVAKKATARGLTEFRCHNRCGISYESQELNVFLTSDEGTQYLPFLFFKKVGFPRGGEGGSLVGISLNPPIPTYL